MRIGLLGSVEARRGDDPLPLPGLRLRGLLARLALDVGRSVPAGRLVDDLWGDAAPDGAGNALQALVSRLRRAVGAEVVDTVAGGYRLRLEPDAVDVTRFDRLLATAESAEPATARSLLDQALALWQGPAMADLAELPFVAAAAARLDERRARAVEGRAQLALRLGDPEPELDALGAQLDALPLREHTAVLLARCLHAVGRQADALAVLDRTTARLAEELGVDPGAELAATRLDVLRTAPAPPTAPAPRTALSSFVGRDGDLARVRALLAGTRLVTLIGPGGAGKTRLARESVAGAPGRLVVAELAPLTTADQLPAVLLTAAAGQALLRPQEDPVTDPVGRLVAALAGADVTLLLDNCEHLVDAVARLAETVLEACPRLRVLATSREPLGVPGEVLHPVDALAPADAVRLFADRAAAVAPGFGLTGAVAPVVEEICRRLDGQPLPIELAAARLRTLSPAEIAARLDDRFRLLTSGARTALPRHQTLRAVVDWSWELLAEPERAVARRLAAFAGGSTVEGAEAVCSGPGGPRPAEVFDLLASLVDKSMVVAVTSPDGPTRYRMLETIREYAGERLDEAGERAAAEAAHGRLWLELVETAEPYLRTAEQLTWLARLTAAAEEIDLALFRAVAAGDADTAHRLLAGMVWGWTIRGLEDEGLRWAPQVHRMTGPAPLPARALNAMFMMLLQLGGGNVFEAESYLDGVLELLGRLDRPAHPLLQLFEPVRAMFTEADDRPLRELAEHAPDLWVRTTALGGLAAWAENDGRIDDQRRYTRRAHELAVAVGDRFMLGMVVLNLGELEDVAGHHEAAARAFDEAIALATELSNEDDLPMFTARRAMLDARRGDLDAARAGLAEAGRLARENWQFTSALCSYRAEVDRLSGHLDRARAELDRAAAAVPLLPSVGSPLLGTGQRQSALAAIRAQVELDAGDPEAAREHLATAVDFALDSRDGPATAVVAEAVARLAFVHGDAERAAALLGVAAAQRGAPDRGNGQLVELDAAVRRTLGADPAQRAFDRARALPRRDGLELLRDAVAAPQLRAAQVRFW